MESKSETVYIPRYPVVSKIDVTSLKKCADLMGPIEKRAFDNTYGNLRKLLLLEVQTDAIIALSRFYDSEIRCFLFKNFQMAPTLEEYEQILGLGRSGADPYQYQELYYTDEKCAALLQVSVENLKLQKLKKNTVIGLSQNYLENLMVTYSRSKNWATFKPLLALTIFGIVLFPHIERFIDVTVIGIFLASQDEKSPINPVPAILADTYSAFTHHSEFKRRKIICSSHLLYTWLLTHIVTHQKQVDKLVDYALSCEVNIMGIQKWIQTLGKLDEHSVRWYLLSCWDDRPEIVVHCGGFQNVPLMGTKGCINYNPSLTIRQLGYPMRNPPTKEMLSRFYIFEGGAKDDALLRKVLQAWGTVIRHGKTELAKRNDGISFRQWLERRIQIVQLPYQKALQVETGLIEPSIPVVEELGEVKLALLKAEEEKKLLEAEMEKLASRNKKLEEENALKSVVIEEIGQKLKIEEKSKQKAQKYLQSAKDELKKTNLKEKKAIGEAAQWKDLWEESKLRKKVAQDMLADSKKESRKLQAEWESKLNSIRQDRDSLENILREYQRALRVEQENADELRRNIRHIGEAYRQVREESQYWEHKFVGLLGRIEEQEIIIELRSEVQQWKDRFSELAELANQAFMDVPKKLRKAETEMLVFNTPPAVYRFVKFCRDLVEEVKKKTRGVPTGSKRKRTEDYKALCI